MQAAVREMHHQRPVVLDREDRRLRARTEFAMEGSSVAKARELIRRASAECLRRAGLPAKIGAARAKAKPRVTDNFKRDVAAGVKYWRQRPDLLAKLPKKAERKAEEQYAADLILSDCRRLREDFLTRHAETIYLSLTKNHGIFMRVDDIVYDAGTLVPGINPTNRHVRHERAARQ